MPLALAQAGAYIRQTNISVREYLEHYDNTWDDLIAEQDQYPLLEYAQRSMLTTWTISYQQVERQSMAAAKLLKLWAYLDPKDIWYELLACAIELQPQIKMPEWLLTLVKNRLTYRGALGLLRKYSLVNNGTDTTSYSMHAVLHSWCRHLACMSDMSEAFPELAVSIVAQMVPDEGNGQDWSLWRRLFPHGQQLLFYLRCGSAWRLSLVPVGLYEKLAKLFEHNKAYDEAAEILERALKETERVSGQDHVSTLEAFVKLARMYFRMGRDRHSESEGLYRRALAGCEEALRLGHTDPIAIYQLMSSVLFGLGRHCIAQRSFEAGEAMFRRAMRICGQRSDVGKQIGLDISRALGASYVEQHKFVEAEEAYQHALEESIEIYDSDHHRTLEISWHLSEIYHKLGRVAESKELAERTAAVFDNKLGMNRDLTLDLMDSRLFLYKRLGKFAEAEVMAKQALDETKKRFGEDHRKTLRAIYQLATCYDGQINKLHEARVLYEQLVLRCTEVFGPDDIITAKIMYCLGVLYCNKLRMLSEAEELFMRVLRTSETLKGPNHEETLSVAYSLGCVYNKQGDRVREVKIRQRVLTACEDTVGIEHERTIKASLLLDLSLQRPHGFFTLSSHTITLDSDWKLIAFCERVDGSWNRSTLSLNNVLENVCGHFSWGRAGNFVATARNVRLKGKGGLLVADL
jgi:tetratricopeptide (TPR) repeat protein